MLNAVLDLERANSNLEANLGAVRLVVVHNRFHTVSQLNSPPFVIFGVVVVFE